MNDSTSLSPVDFRVRFSLRFKLTTGLILIIVMIFAGLNIFNLLSHRNTRFSEANNTSRTIARLLAGALTTQLADRDLTHPALGTFLSNFQSSAIQLNKDLAFVLVATADNQLVSGRARPELIRNLQGDAFNTEPDALNWALAQSGRLGADMKVSKITLANNQGTSVGTLMVGTSLLRIQNVWHRDLIVNIAAFVAALLAVIVYGSIALGRLVVSPIRKLVGSMQQVHEGELDTEVEVRRSDEIGVLANTYNYMLQGLRDRERLKDAFSRYVSRQVYEKFQAGEINLEGETRQATVLFSDIRSFTNLSEQLTPAEVVALLNEYFNEMVEIIFKYDGFLNKFIGDAIMAIYNVPLDQHQPELRAVRSALEMITALQTLNEKRAARGQFPLKIGIGINTGPVVAGNIGHEKRLEYTVIGDAVNLAQRIESQTKVSGTSLLISDTTYQAVAPYVEAQALPPVKVKGKQEPVTLYAVTGLRTIQTAAPPVAMGAPPPAKAG